MAAMPPVSTLCRSDFSDPVTVSLSSHPNKMIIFDSGFTLLEQEEQADIVCDYFAAGLSLMKFLCKAQQVPF